MTTTAKIPDSPPAERQKVTLPGLADIKRLGQPITMITAYDYPSACVVEEAGVDIVLVGDSAAMTVLGHDSTVPITTDEMIMLAAAVRRGLEHPLLVGDMPFGSYQSSDEQAVDNAIRFVKEAGCDAVKVEGAGTTLSRVRAIVGSGISVMGHVGLTPQSATALGGYKAQGRTAEKALAIAEDALALQEAGCFSIVFEAVPAPVTDEIVPRIEVPVIGIGAGPSADGQVLVFHDLLGIYDGHSPRFAKRYSKVREAMIEGVEQYVQDVRGGSFPESEHCYSIDPDELDKFRTGFNRSRKL